MKNSNHKLVYIVDDDPDDRQIILDAFMENKYQGDYEFIESGNQLLDNLETNAMDYPSLILLDLNMPGIKGLDALFEIRSKMIKMYDPANVEKSSKAVYCHMSYSDNGIGFDAQYNLRIFEVFQRLHSQEDFPGTGIGLAICKRIIENHNGLITASGKPNKGTRFDMYIPEPGLSLIDEQKMKPFSVAAEINNGKDKERHQLPGV